MTPKPITILAASILLFAVFILKEAQAGGFGVADNRVTITTNVTSYMPTVNGSGLVSAIHAMQGTSLESLGFSLVKQWAYDDTYFVDIGVIVDDADNMRRIEAFLPGIQVMVAGSDTTVTVPATDLVIAGRSHDGFTTFVTRIQNLEADGPITAVNNSIVFNLTRLQDKILARFGTGGETEILNQVSEEGRYSYTVLVKSPVPIGYVGDGSTVNPFPSFDVGPADTQSGLNLSQIFPGAAESPIAGAAATSLNGICYVLRGAFGVGTGNDAPAPGALPTANATPMPSTPLSITPGKLVLFREAQELQHTFEISGGVPFSAGIPFYELQISRESVAGFEMDMAPYDSATGKYLYTFETLNRPDGNYYILVRDMLGNVATAGPISIATLSLEACSVSEPVVVSGGDEFRVLEGSVFSGTSIIVPPGALSGGISFALVSQGAPFLAGVRGNVFSLETSTGQEATFSTPVTVTIDYSGLMLTPAEAAALVPVHYNEKKGQWELAGSPPYTNLEGKLTFHTSSFSLFALSIPTPFTLPPIIGAGTQAGEKDFYMISIPGNPAINKLRKHLEGTLGAYDDRKWRLFAYDPESGEYVEANQSAFDLSFGPAPGRGYWLISRDNTSITVPTLAFDEETESVFHTVLYPGWNMVSHPWANDVALNSHDIEVSNDGTDWYSVDEGLHVGPFWRFLGRAGSSAQWYENLVLEGSNPPPGTPDPLAGSGGPATGLSTLKPHESYWLKNLTNPPRPVFLRMIKRNHLNDAITLQTLEVPGHLRMLAVKWLEKALFSGDRVSIAQSAGDQPPDPPAMDSERNTIGVASGGGGGCFIQTATGSLDDSGAPALSSVSRKADRMGILPVSLLAIFFIGLVSRMCIRR